MESTTLKAENLKPIILKAGVPLAVSIAGVIYAWIITKKTIIPQPSSIHDEEISSMIMEDEEELEDTPMNNSISSSSISSSGASGRRLVIHDNPCLEQDIGGLRTKIEGLKLKELALSFCDMKGKESLLAEIKSILSVEAAQAEFLDREISSLERVNLRVENFVGQYLRIVDKLEYWRSENRVIKRKVKKMIRESKVRNRLIKEQDMKIKAGEGEILRNHDELEKRICLINNLEGEIREMKEVLDQLKDEKNEVMKKLDIAEKAYASKVEAGDVSKEDYNKLVNELEQVKKEREDEFEELIQLRWTNACLRHELMRHHQEQQKQHDQYNGDVMHYESDHDELHHSFLENHHNIVTCFGSGHNSGDHVFSRRKRFLRRLKRLVKPTNEGENNHVRNKCFGMNSDPTTHVPARRSCS